ncbi:Uncharacterised protein [Mycobacteroides abscessus subsp. abscessus]|nr:Uncharacterised protein [Mycobacteroides abscessus subsp. abscessus]
MTASVTITGVKYLLASGNSWTQYRSIANVPTLSTTAIISTALDGVACTAASGSQVCSGQSGAFTANANMNPRKSAFARPGSIPSAAVATISVISRRSNVPPCSPAGLWAVTT